MKKGNEAYAEAVLEDVCGELNIDVPERINANIVIDPGAKTTDSILNNIERSFHSGRPTNLGNISDLTRCSVIGEDLTQVKDYIKKLREQVPCLHGVIKKQKFSGYIGVHLHTKMNGIPGEIQYSTPLFYRVKSVADENYRRTRLYSSLIEKSEREKLTKAEKIILEEQRKDFERRRAMEARLFKMLREVTGIDGNLPEIERMIQYTLKQSAKDYLPLPHASILNDWRLITRGSKGKVDLNKLLKSTGILRPYIDIAQTELCKKAREPIRRGLIVDSSFNYRIAEQPKHRHQNLELV